MKAKKEIKKVFGKYQDGGKTGSKKSLGQEYAEKQINEGKGTLKYLTRLHTVDYMKASASGHKDPLKTAQGSIQGYETEHGKGSFMRDVRNASEKVKKGAEYLKEEKAEKKKSTPKMAKGGKVSKMKKGGKC